MRLKWITYCCPVLQRVVHLARLAFQVNRITANPRTKLAWQSLAKREGEGEGGVSSRAQGIFANREDFTFSILDFERLATMMKRRGDDFFF